LRQIGDNVFADAVGEVLLFGVARHVRERQNGDRRRLDFGRRVGGIGLLSGDIRLTGMPLPDSDRTIDILDTYVTAILETNVDSIANAFVDDRGDAATGLSERFQTRGDVDTIAIDVVVFGDDIAEIDA